MSEQYTLHEPRISGNIAVVRVGGRVGATAAKDLRNLCADLRGRGVKHIVVNMEEVSFIASSGIGALVVLSGESDIGGGSARFVSVSPPVLRVIRLLNLQHFLIVEDDEDEALSKIGAAV